MCKVYTLMPVLLYGYSVLLSPLEVCVCGGGGGEGILIFFFIINIM